MPNNFTNTSTILPSLGGNSHRSSVLNADYKQLQSQLKDKDDKAKWYEDALQKRFDQMEEFEAKSDQLEIKCSQLEAKLEKGEHGLKIKTTQAEKAQERIRELELKLEEQNSSPKEAGEDVKRMMDHKIQENFSLKDIIDGLRKETDKQKKRILSQDDMYINKQIEID